MSSCRHNAQAARGTGEPPRLPTLLRPPCRHPQGAASAGCGQRQRGRSRRAGGAALADQPAAGATGKRPAASNASSAKCNAHSLSTLGLMLMGFSSRCFAPGRRRRLRPPAAFSTTTSSSSSSRQAFAAAARAGPQGWTLRAARGLGLLLVAGRRHSLMTLSCWPAGPREPAMCASCAAAWSAWRASRRTSSCGALRCSSEGEAGRHVHILPGLVSLAPLPHCLF